MGAIVTIMLVKERQIVEAFMRAGATSASSAVHPGDIAVDLGGVGGRRLVRGAIIREAGEVRHVSRLLAQLPVHTRAYWGGSHASRMERILKGVFPPD